MNHHVMNTPLIAPQRWKLWIGGIVAAVAAACSFLADRFARFADSESAYFTLAGIALGFSR
jgi:hypothetical protein